MGHNFEKISYLEQKTIIIIIDLSHNGASFFAHKQKTYYILQGTYRSKIFEQPYASELERALIWIRV